MNSYATTPIAFDKDELPLSLDWYTDMRRVLETYPDLGLKGFYARGDAAQQQRAMLARDHVAGFGAAKFWFGRFRKRPEINLLGNSQMLRRLAERDTGVVSLGVFIAAGIADGFRIRRDGYDVYFNISSRAWRYAKRRLA